MEDSCLCESIPTHYVVQEAVEAVTHVLWVPGDCEITTWDIHKMTEGGW